MWSSIAIVHMVDLFYFYFRTCLSKIEAQLKTQLKKQLNLQGWPNGKTA